MRTEVRQKHAECLNSRFYAAINKCALHTHIPGNTFVTFCNI